MKHEDLKVGHLYAIAPHGRPTTYGYFVGLFLGVCDYAAYYAEMDSEDGFSDPTTWLQQWIDNDDLRPAPGYVDGADGPFEYTGYAREDTAHANCWLMPWSEWLAQSNVPRETSKEDS